MPWWSWIPSLRPLKGLANFTYIWANWETISAEQKKRDERLQAVEEVAQQMIRLREQAHAEEKKALERKMKQEVARWRALAKEGSDAIGAAIGELNKVNSQVVALEEEVEELAQRLAVTLYTNEDADFREVILSKFSPPVHKLVSGKINQIEVAVAALQHVMPPPVPPLGTQIAPTESPPSPPTTPPALPPTR